MKKPYILLVIDKPNWAYDHIANFIIDQLSHKYNFHKLIAHYNIKKELKDWKYKIKEIPRNYKRWRYENFSFDIVYDICVYLWWFTPQMIEKKIKSKHELRGIFTEMFPPGNTVNFNGSLQGFVDDFIKPADGLIAGNKNIFNLYSKSDISVDYATGCTDTNLFKVSLGAKLNSSFTVCWTGNPNRNFKGYYDFICPAINQAKKKYPDINFVTRFSGSIKKLPKLYSGVDVMVNASIGDAGPGFIGDAGACGVPTISVNTGIASEVIKDNITGFFVERNIDCIAEKIIYVYENRDILKDISINIRKKIVSEYAPANRAYYWDQLFTKYLSK